MIKNIFISYRRNDVAFQAHWIRRDIEARIRNVNVFLDSGSLQTGENFPEKISEALEKVDIFLVLIGNEWLRSHDESGRRRIDGAEDWVRKEIKMAINKKDVFPILIGSSVVMPTRSDLPRDISKLAATEAARLRETDWDADITKLISRIASRGLELKPETSKAREVVTGDKDQRIKYPNPELVADPLPKKELDIILKRLKGWESQFKQPLEGTKKAGIQKVFEFKTFEDAIHFMNTASRYITTFNHHPEWENIWRSIIIWITTWDIDGKLTILDIALAEYFDRLFEQYE